MQTEIYWVHDFQPGRLAVMPRPRGGKELADEIQYLANLGVSTICSLLTDEEIAELKLTSERDLCKSAGVQYLSLPIEDHDVPASTADVAALVDRLCKRLRRGKSVAVHCRAGIGRSAVIAACVLLRHGFSPRQAFTMLTQARGFPSPETQEQRRWVIDFAEGRP